MTFIAQFFVLTFIFGNYIGQQLWADGTLNTSPSPSPTVNDNSHVLRLLPGNDLRLSLEDFANINKIEAGWIVTCAGSLTAYSIRFANQNKPSGESGYFEIINLAGTISVNGCHIHISIADDKGKTIGGHLMHGCKIYTTAEIVLVESGSYLFTRVVDDNTKFKELRIIKK